MKVDSPQIDRIFWLDSVKIIAIFLVIFIHSASTPQLPTTNRLDWIILVFYDSITRICVPLFIMASGALLLGKLESYRTFFKKRISRILMPWIFWTVIYLLWFIATNKIQSLSDFAQQTHELSFSYFWFMPMISGLYLLTPMLRLWIQRATNKDVMYALILWFMIYSVFPLCMKLVSPDFIIPNPFVFEHLGYFILGYVLLHLQKPLLKAKQLTLLLVGCFMGNSIGTFLAYAFNRPDLQTYFWSNLSFFAIAASICAFLLIKSICKKIESTLNKRVVKIVATVSNASLGIYLVHGLILNILPFPQLTMHVPYALKIVIVAIIVLAVSMSIIVTLQKTPVKRFIA